MNATSLKRRRLEWWERCELENQGCRADDWQNVLISDATHLPSVRNALRSGFRPAWVELTVKPAVFVDEMNR